LFIVDLLVRNHKGYWSRNKERISSAGN